MASKPGKLNITVAEASALLKTLHGVFKSSSSRSVKHIAGLPTFSAELATHKGATVLTEEQEKKLISVFSSTGNVVGLGGSITGRTGMVNVLDPNESYDARFYVASNNGIFSNPTKKLNAQKLSKSILLQEINGIRSKHKNVLDVLSAIAKADPDLRATIYNVLGGCFCKSMLVEGETDPNPPYGLGHANFKRDEFLASAEKLSLYSPMELFAALINKHPSDPALMALIPAYCGGRTPDVLKDAIKSAHISEQAYAAYNANYQKYSREAADIANYNNIIRTDTAVTSAISSINTNTSTTDLSSDFYTLNPAYMPTKAQSKAAIDEYTKAVALNMILENVPPADRSNLDYIKRVEASKYKMDQAMAEVRRLGLPIGEVIDYATRKAHDECLNSTQQAALVDEQGNPITDYTGTLGYKQWALESAKISNLAKFKVDAELSNNLMQCTFFRQMIENEKRSLSSGASVNKLLLYIQNELAKEKTTPAEPTKPAKKKVSDLSPDQRAAYDTLRAMKRRDKDFSERVKPDSIKRITDKKVLEIASTVHINDTIADALVLINHLQSTGMSTEEINEVLALVNTTSGGKPMFEIKESGGQIEFRIGGETYTRNAADPTKLDRNVNLSECTYAQVAAGANDVAVAPAYRNQFKAQAASTGVYDTEVTATFVSVGSADVIAQRARRANTAATQDPTSVS